MTSWISYRPIRRAFPSVFNGYVRINFIPSFEASCRTIYSYIFIHPVGGRSCMTQVSVVIKNQEVRRNEGHSSSHATATKKVVVLKYHIQMCIFLIFRLPLLSKYLSAPDSAPLHPIPPHSTPYIFPRPQGCRETRHPSTFLQGKLSIFNYFPYFS